MRKSGALFEAGITGVAEGGRERKLSEPNTMELPLFQQSIIAILRQLTYNREFIHQTRSINQLNKFS